MRYQTACTSILVPVHDTEKEMLKREHNMSDDDIKYVIFFSFLHCLNIQFTEVDTGRAHSAITIVMQFAPPVGCCQPSWPLKFA